MRKIFVIVIAMLILSVGNSYALINGLIDGTEWDTFDIHGTDVNEGTITDGWDIKEVFLKVVGGDGWYFRMDTYATPFWTGAPGQAAGDEAFWQFRLDLDGDLAVDWIVDFNDKSDPNSRIVGLYNSVGTKTADDGDGTDGALSAIIEMYVPHSELSTGLFGSKSALYAVSDGKGSDPDDRLPNRGWVTRVPEPSSMMLLGLGLFGFAGGAIRRRFKV